MKILNVEVEFDFFDVEQAEKLENSMEQAAKEMENLNVEEIKQSEFIRKMCTIIEDCFENIFGKEITKKMFGDKKNFLKSVQAFEELTKCKEEQENAVLKEVTSIANEIAVASEKYSPNRIKRIK